MSNQLKPAPDEVFSDNEREHTFKIAVVFDGDEALRAAESTCNFVEEKVGGESPTHKEFFKCRLLQGENLERAGMVAAESDMILVALRQMEEPSVELQNWVSLWLNRREISGGALVAVLSTVPGDENPSGIRAFLQKTAAKAGMDFLCRSFRPATHERI